MLQPSDYDRIREHLENPPRRFTKAWWSRWDPADPQRRRGRPAPPDGVYLSGDALALLKSARGKLELYGPLYDTPLADLGRLPERCPRCKGDGRVVSVLGTLRWAFDSYWRFNRPHDGDRHLRNQERALPVCPRCQGEGTLLNGIERLPVEPPAWRCEGCRGHGTNYPYSDDCAECKGTGRTPGYGTRDTDYPPGLEPEMWPRPVDEPGRRNATTFDYVGAPGSPDVRLPAGRLVLASGRVIARAWLAAPPSNDVDDGDEATAGEA